MTPRRLLALAGTALAAAWLITPHAVPLYDGVGFPDEPYRYVAQPPNLPRTPVVTTASYRVNAIDGKFPESIFFYSGESGPQISILIRSNITAPPGTRGLVFSATPLAPDGPVEGAELDGNVYRLAAVPDPPGGPVTMSARPDATGKLIMRATSARLGPKVHFRATPRDPWRPLETDRVGQDNWGANPQGFGDYVLAYPPGAGAPAAESGGSGRSYVVVTVSLLALILGVVLVTIRLSRRSST